jgi:hypothetical protein
MQTTRTPRIVIEDLPALETMSLEEQAAVIGAGRRSARLGVEWLEGRELMAGSLTAGVTGGVLNVEGSINGSEKIRVLQTADHVEVFNLATGSQVGNFASNTVHSVRIDTPAGHDLVFIDPSVRFGAQLTGIGLGDILIESAAGATQDTVTASGATRLTSDRSVTAAGQVYTLHGQDLYANGQKLTSNVLDFAVDRNGTAYVKDTSNNLLQQSGTGFRTVAAGVAKFTLVNGQTLAYSTGTGALVVGGSQVVASGVSDFMVDSLGRVVEMDVTGNLLRSRQALGAGGFDTLAGNVTRFALAPFGSPNDVLYLQNDGTARSTAGISWTGIQDVAVDSHGSVLLLRADGTLERRASATASTVVAGHVTDIGVSRDGVLFYNVTQTVLYQTQSQLYRQGPQDVQPTAVILPAKLGSLSGTFNLGGRFGLDVNGHLVIQTLGNVNRYTVNTDGSLTYLQTLAPQYANYISDFLLQPDGRVLILFGGLYEVSAGGTTPGAPTHVTAILNGTTLLVTGTNGADTITVRQQGGQVSVDGVMIIAGKQFVRSVAATSLERVTVNAGGGDDTVRYLRAAGETAKPFVSLYGQGGLDTLIAPDNAFISTGSDGEPGVISLVVPNGTTLGLDERTGNVTVNGVTLPARVFALARNAQDLQTNPGNPVGSVAITGGMLYTFQNGVVYDTTAGTYLVGGVFYASFKALGGEAVLGRPTSASPADIISTGGQTFTNGFLYRGGTSVYGLTGPAFQKYLSLRGQLGDSVGGPQGLANGFQVQQFTHGVFFTKGALFADAYIDSPHVLRVESAAGTLTVPNVQSFTALGGAQFMLQVGSVLSAEVSVAYNGTAVTLTFSNARLNLGDLGASLNSFIDNLKGVASTLTPLFSPIAGLQNLASEIGYGGALDLASLLHTAVQADPKLGGQVTPAINALNQLRSIYNEINALPTLSGSSIPLPTFTATVSGPALRVDQLSGNLLQRAFGLSPAALQPFQGLGIHILSVEDLVQSLLSGNGSLTLFTYDLSSIPPLSTPISVPLASVMPFPGVTLNGDLIFTPALHFGGAISLTASGLLAGNFTAGLSGNAMVTASLTVEASASIELGVQGADIYGYLVGGTATLGSSIC